MALDVHGRVLTALITPFDGDGRVDLGVAADLARSLAARGSDGFVVAGTTGEAPTLSAEEKLDLCRAVRRAVDGRASVWLNAGSYDTAESARLAAEAQDSGADGVMAVVPYYNRPPQRGLQLHFAAIAKATPLPVMVYNVPARTGTNLLPATLAALVDEAPNVTACKEASRDLEQVAEICRLLPPSAGFRVYSGDDGLTLPVMAVGGAGVVSVASHIVPERVAEVVRCCATGEWERARAVHLALLPLVRALFCTTNPIPVKVALRMCGFPAGGFRPPLCEPGEAERQTILRGLEAQGLLGALRA
jgi:4-hydroxy-tetrahydrodipicolinate synthase